MNSLPRTVAIALGCLLASVLFFSPHLWLMRHYVPGSFEWDRAHTFLLQCAQPLRQDIETAMRWRLLPPLVCRGLGLKGNAPLVAPWSGAFAATAYVAELFRRRRPDTRFIVGGTLLFVSTSAILVPTGWLGMNDAWVWLGLLAVAFGRSAWALPVACLLCPWIDERFLLGLPLAWCVRCLDRSTPLWTPGARGFLALAPYAVLRLLFGGDPLTNPAERTFLAASSSHEILPFVPLGWWMGLRAAWFPVAFAAGTEAPLRRRLVAALCLAAGLIVCVALASDLSRSAAMAIPAALLGCFELNRRYPGHAPRLVLILGCLNLLLPAAHVVYTKIALINPLPLELLRLLRP